MDSDEGLKTEEEGRKQKLRDMLATVSDNAAELKFPTDKWGFTTSVKRTLLQAAGNVRGRDDKHDVLVATIMILLQHIHKRKEKDKKAAESRAKKMAEAAGERLARQRVQGEPANKGMEARTDKAE